MIIEIKIDGWLRGAKKSTEISPRRASKVKTAESIFAPATPSPKKWIADIGHTIVGAPFAKFVKTQTDVRNQTVASKSKLNIAMDPELAAAFAAST